MSDRPKPSHGNEAGPCAICGSYAYPKYGEFLCAKHGKRKYAERVEND